LSEKKNKGVALVLPYANTEAMQLHLDEISKSVTKGYHAVIVMDDAGWHLAKELQIPKNISIIKLPPYSPELNPMEQLFQQLRKLKLSNTCYANHDKIDQSCDDAWNQFILDGQNIRSLALREWADCY
jgi:transposase